MIKKLLIKDIYTLDGELKGISDQSTGKVFINGLLQQKLPIVIKYWLTDLSKKTGEVRTTIDGLRNDLIQKYGVSDDDRKTYKIPTENMEDFQKEFQLLFSEEKEIDIHNFKLDEFTSMETTDNYEIFYTLLTV